MDFKNSLAVGIEAAKKARSNKEEIFSIISELSDSIKEYSQGRVFLKITSEKKLASNQTALTAVVSSFTNINPYIDYEALSFVTKREQTEVKENIAVWKINESDGYPCVISYNKRDVRCKDKETLIKALNDLMSDASTGEILLRLMNTEEA
ncbi:hypothetical protein OM315_24360 [Escherichia albertii]|uniref:hypothetical protein n=1 Tax=Escherichia albertii TaxID=208962 RepID=UPI001A115CB8|nr:hypothetical protein [Escherichia albertii]MCU7295048.1 hypothetical protein [Escherichia albertii]MCZ8925533.1 hypothetical protein [Escherichia albertii]MCZ9152631.1 hypothetical protein [Escherichia albertii]MCZ9221876.1 hypothetical protein [Escherichia albertii]